MQPWHTPTSTYSKGPYMYGPPVHNAPYYKEAPAGAALSRHRKSHSSTASPYDPPLPPVSQTASQHSYAPASGDLPVFPSEPFAPQHHPYSDRVYDRNVMPIKSAMKKPKPEGHGVSGGASLQRSRTVPVPAAEVEPRRSRPVEPRNPTAPPLSRRRTLSKNSRANSLTRPRSRSQSRHFTPDHLFLSFSGSNKISISSVNYQITVDTIRERVLLMWPDGVVLQSYRNETNEYIIQFAGNPWTAKGILGLMAMKLILELFAVLARQGFHCTSAFDTGNSSSPRLIFTLTDPEPVAEFFMMIFCESRRKIVLVNASHHVCQSLADELHTTFERRVVSAVWDDTDVFKIVMRKFGFELISDLMIATILQHLKEMDMKLEGTIPLPHTGFWSMFQGPRELWIFRRLRPSQ